MTVGSIEYGMIGISQPIEYLQHCPIFATRT